MRFYRSHFVYAPPFYHQPHHQRLITGESSPDYIFDLHAPKRIATCLPNVKLIVLLRNPVDRAYSHYLHNVRAAWDMDREPLSFEAAIAAEEGRLQGEREKLLQDDSYFSYSYMHYSYLARGLYADQLDIWFSLFSREQMLILKSEDLLDNPSRIFRQVLEFLELPMWQLPEYESFNAKNKDSTPINPDTRLQLVKYYQPHNERLSDLLKIPLNWDF